MLVKLLVAVVLLLVGLGLAVRLYMSRPGEDRLYPGEAVDIRGLRDPLPGNAFLACPPDYCAATATFVPVFDLPVDRLAEAWRVMITDMPHVTIVADPPEQHRLVVIDRTALLRFPDVVTVEFVAVSPDRSSLAIYSRSRYGRGDFGINRRRVLAWLAELERRAAR